MFDLIRNGLRKYPKFFYILYILAITIILDFTCAKIFWKRLATHPEYYALGLRCIDPYCHHSFHKDVDAMDRWGHDSYHVITDSLGFKDSIDRIVRPKPDGQRIIFIGDSFTEGVGLPFEQTFVGIIAKSLGERNTEVLNAGVCSYSPKLYFLKIQHLLQDEQIKFNKLFVFIDMSDVQDEIIYKNYVPRPYGAERQLKDYLKIYAIRYSVIGNAVDRIARDFWSGYAESSDEADRTMSRIMDNYRDDDQYEYERSGWYSDRNYPEWGFQGSILAKYYLSQLVRLCRANNIEVAVAVYPWPRQVYENAAENKHVLFWRQFAREQKIGFIDFFPLFMSSDPARSVQQYYFSGNMHFNSVGNALIAREFLRWYRQNGERSKSF